MVRWFVCPNVSMVTTGHATGLEKTTGHATGLEKTLLNLLKNFGNHLNAPI